MALGRLGSRAHTLAALRDHAREGSACAGRGSHPASGGRRQSPSRQGQGGAAPGRQVPV